VFYEAFAVFVTMPWLAIIPAIVFYGAYRRWPFKLVLTAALLWLIYMLYELAMLYGILCGEDCNIRVDLLAIYPLLAGISVLALVQIIWSLFARKSG